MPTKKTTGATKAPTAQPESREAPAAKSRTWPVRREGSLEILEAPQLARLDWLIHGFSTVTAGRAGSTQREGGEKSTSKC